MGVSNKTLIGVLLIFTVGVVYGGATGWTFQPDALSASGPGGGGGGDADFNFEDSDIKAAVFDEAADSQTQVAADVHYEVGGTVSTVGVAASDRTSLGTFNPGESVEMVAFNDSSDYFYAETQTVTADEKIKRVNLNVWKPISSGNVALDVYDETNSKNPSSISLGADDSYTFEDLKVTADAADRTYNPQVVAVKYSENISEVTFSDDGVTEMESVPDSLDNYDQAFKVFGATEGEPVLQERQTASAGKFTVVSDKDNDPASTSLDIATKDLALHLNDNGEYEYAIEDSNGNDEGVSDVTTSVTIN